MLYSYNWLQHYSKYKLPQAEKLEELLNTHSFEVEEVKKQTSDYLFDISVLPNRSHDCLGHFGMAKEIAAITNGKTIALKTVSSNPRKGKLAKLTVHIQNRQMVARYAALVIEGIQVKPSPKKLRDRLEAVGLHSINNVVDVTNYVMLEMGQPLHAFDYDQIEGAVMTVRESRKGEEVETLDDQTLSLQEGVLVIEDKNRLIDLAGIKGGKESAISQKTKHIVLQAANFDPITIYKARKQMGYSTQAAVMYSHGIDPNLAMISLQRALFLLKEAESEGKVVQVIDIYPVKRLAKKILLHAERIESLLGVWVPLPEIKRILLSIGCQVTGNGKHLRVQIPTSRMDLAIEEDLVEEIGRIYGYDQIPAVFPLAPLDPPLPNKEWLLQESVRDALRASGYTETYSYSFISATDPSKFLYTPSDRKKLVELQNPISEDFSYMRPTLLENLLKHFSQNARISDELKIFEVGKVFGLAGKNYAETGMVAGFVGERQLEQPFYQAKGAVAQLCEWLGIAGVWYDEYKHAADHAYGKVWHATRCAKIKVHGKEIGLVGEISRHVSANLKLPFRVAAFQINMEMLAQFASSEKQYQEIVKYPSVVRDVALLVHKRTKVFELLDAIGKAGGILVKDISLFDLYEGSGLPEGKKNIAFHIVYQADDRTLTGEEIEQTQSSIIAVLETNPQWEVRK